MTKYKTLDLWNERYPNDEEVYDYAGRLMKKSACGNPDSKFHPTIDHIRPQNEKEKGKDIKENIKICHRKTNEEKGDKFPHWEANGKKFKAKKKKATNGGYEIVSDEK